MNDLLDSLLKSPASVKLLIAPPGAGKSTMVPIKLIQSGLRFVMVEPRRAAAQGLYEYLNHPHLGCHVRYFCSDTLEKKGELITPGILIQYLYHGFPIPVDLIVLDEVHERSRDLDFAMALCRQKNLPMILLSATVNPDDFCLYSPDVFEYTSTSYPVQTEYESEMSVPSEKNLADRVYKILKNRKFHSALVFVPGKAEMSQVMQALSFIKPVYGIHGGMPLSQQSRALYSLEERILVSTNVCESSLTPSGIDLVVDSGLCRLMMLSRGREILSLAPITEESARQRQGRTGRVGPGICVRMWGKKIRLEEKLLPEILRTSLGEIIFRSQEMGLDPKRLPWLSPPLKTQWDNEESGFNTVDANDSLKFLPVPVALISGLKELVKQGHPGLDCILFFLALMEGCKNWESKVFIEPDVTIPRPDWIFYQMDREERLRILGSEGFQKVDRAYLDLRFRLKCQDRTQKVMERDEAILFIAHSNPRYLFYPKKRQGLFGNDFNQEVELSEIYWKPNVAAVLILEMVAIKDGTSRTRLSGSQIFTIPQQLAVKLPATRIVNGEAQIQDKGLFLKRQYLFGNRVLDEKVEHLRGKELVNVLANQPGLLDRIWPWFNELQYYFRLNEPEFNIETILEESGVEDFSDLLLLNPQDVFGSGLIHELKSLKSLYPRELSEPGGSYQMRYDLKNNLVTFESNRSNKVPSALLQARFSRYRRHFVFKGKIQEI
ncbi:MAG: hypothetical protein H3C47_08945, partial [Candidatus Cloacimonetes bacterium]|nr:hypothetical protein [Candidatus Cloacimonadota bacterium]